LAFSRNAGDGDRFADADQCGPGRRQRRLRVLERDAQGRIAFGVTNFTIPQVVAGIKVFDGKTPGTLTQRDYIGDSVPAEFAPQGQEKGTYTVNSDCTGSMVINLNTFGVPPVTTQGGVINILFVISDGGRHIHEVVSELTPPGASGPEPVQTSADDWKVASQWSN
jgi:hypothetical protein